MARDGSGNYTLPVNSWNPATNGSPATAADWQSLINDVASAVSASVAKDGQTAMTGDLSLGGNKITNLDPGTATTDAVNKNQLNTLDSTGISAYMKTVLDDADAATARATLGVADNIFSPVEVYAVKSSDQSTSSTTGVSATFGTEVFDNASAFSGGTFTAPVAGTYEVSWALYCVKDGTLGNVFMFYNTQADGTFWRFAASETKTISHTTTITLAAGDTIVPKIAVSAGSVTVYGTTSNAVRCSWLRIRRVA